MTTLSSSPPSAQADKIAAAVSSAPKATTNKEEEEEDGGCGGDDDDAIVTPLLAAAGVIHSNSTVEQKTKEEEATTTSFIMMEFKSTIGMEVDLGKVMAGRCQSTVCQNDKSPTTTATFGVVAFVINVASEFFGRSSTSFFEDVICGQMKETKIKAAAKTTWVAAVMTANTVVVSDLSTLDQQSKSVGATLAGTTTAALSLLIGNDGGGNGNDGSANTTTKFNGLLTSISTSFDVVECIIVGRMSHPKSSHSIKVFFYC